MGSPAPWGKLITGGPLGDINKQNTSSFLRQIPVLLSAARKPEKATEASHVLHVMLFVTDYGANLNGVMSHAGLFKIFKGIN